MSISNHKHLLDCADCKRSDIFQEHAGLFLRWVSRWIFRDLPIAMNVWKPNTKTKMTMAFEKSLSFKEKKVFCP